MLLKHSHMYSLIQGYKMHFTLQAHRSHYWCIVLTKLFIGGSCQYINITFTIKWIEGLK